MTRQLLRAATIGAMLIATAVPALAAPPHIGWTKYGWRTICIELTDHRIRTIMAERGFTNIYLNSRIEREIRVRATMDGWVWQMDVSVCTGDILETRQLRPA
jgi:23S rRNA A1618 N6-methylase RlmF